MIDVPQREMSCLNQASNASIESRGSECKRLNGEDNEEDVPDDDGVPDVDSLELLLQRGAC